MNKIYVLEGARTPFGLKNGGISDLKADEFIEKILKKNEISDNFIVSQCFINDYKALVVNKLLKHSVNELAINGCGLAPALYGFGLLKSGALQDLAICGVDSVSNASYMLKNLRRDGEKTIVDPLDEKEHMYSADKIASDCNISRGELETYAYKSYEKAIGHIQNRKDEIQGDVGLDHDEYVDRIKPVCFPDYDLVFGKTITEATKAPLADGATLLKLSSAEESNIILKDSVISIGKNKADALSQALKNLCAKLDWKIEDVDLFEICESYAVYPVYMIKDLKVPEEKVNVWSGALSLGYPPSATGVRLLYTLSRQLKHYKLKRGVVCANHGGSGAIAIALENIA